MHRPKASGLEQLFPNDPAEVERDDATKSAEASPRPRLNRWGLEPASVCPLGDADCEICGPSS